MGLKLPLVGALLLAAPAVAQTQVPAGTVPASASMTSELKGMIGSWSGGRILKRDCGKAIPPFWRADHGWVRVTYACGR
jgi:hypothetical protein